MFCGLPFLDFVVRCQPVQTVGSVLAQQGIERYQRTIFGLVAGILVASFPALSQAACDDAVALQEVAIQYFGLGEYQGMSETQIRQR